MLSYKFWTVCSGLLDHSLRREASSSLREDSRNLHHILQSRTSHKGSMMFTSGDYRGLVRILTSFWCSRNRSWICLVVCMWALLSWNMETSWGNSICTIGCTSSCKMASGSLYKTMQSNRQTQWLTRDGNPLPCLQWIAGFLWLSPKGNLSRWKESDDVSSDRITLRHCLRVQDFWPLHQVVRLCELALETSGFQMVALAWMPAVWSSQHTVLVETESQVLLWFCGHFWDHSFGCLAPILLGVCLSRSMSFDF